MSKFIDNIVIPASLFMAIGSFYLGAQYGIGKITDNMLQNKEKNKGIAIAVRDASEALEGTRDPFGYILLPGYRISLAEYVSKHKGVLNDIINGETAGKGK